VDFTGAKAALFCGSAVLTYLRDDRPDLRWSSHWDLPGGGPEGDETAETCLLRELGEEFGLNLPPDRLLWRGVFPSVIDAARQSVFYAGRLTADEVARVRFGDEGQFWRLMPLAEFLHLPLVVPDLQRRTKLGWDALTAAG